MIKVAPALFAALMLSACAGTMHSGSSGANDGSMVEGVEPGDRKVLADAAVDLVRRNADSANGSIGVQQAPDMEFTPILLDGLRRAGFGVERGDRLIYQIGPIAEGMMLRVSIDGKDAARLYTRNKDGALEPKGPVTVRSTGVAQ
jgi:hypothetical protein